MSRFDGPRYLLYREGDVRHGLSLYEQLEVAWRRRAESGGKDRSLSGLVAELAARWREPKQWTWFGIRELFSDGDEGRRERASFEEARARLSRGEELEEAPCKPSEPRRYGMQVFGASPERSARLVELHARCVRSGGTPALAETVERQLPEALLAGRLLDPLPRAAGFEVAVEFGDRSELRTASRAYGAL
jgi:hypothetical protein